MDEYRGYPVIDDATPVREILDPRYSRGLVRYSATDGPRPVFRSPNTIPLVPQSEWSGLIKAQDASRSSLEHLYLGEGLDRPAFLNLDQGEDGYCWVYSVGHACMISRLKSNVPHVRLNPHSVGAIIKRGVNEGGYCGLAADWYRRFGCGEEGDGLGQWRKQSRDLSQDTPAFRLAAARNRIIEDVVDLSSPIYSRKLTWLQVGSLLLANVPLACDYNFMGHSIDLIRLVEPQPGVFGVLYLNSWRDWGRFGLGVIAGARAVPDAGIGVVTLAG